MKKPKSCPHCSSSQTRRNGRHKSDNAQKFLCVSCGKSFRGRYKNKAVKPATHKKLERLADQGLSVRKIAATLGISPTTVQTKKVISNVVYQSLINTPYDIPPADRHVVSWSGGKDSSALLVWALAHIPREKLCFVFCDTGWESPVTYRFIDEVNGRLLNGELVILKSQKYDGLLDLAEKKRRFPSVKARFCTEQLKIVPMIEWILEQGCNLAVYQGIRGEESLARSLLKPCDDYFRPQIEYANEPYVHLCPSDRSKHCDRSGQRVCGVKHRKRKPLYQDRVMRWLENYWCKVERPFFHWKSRDILSFCKKHGVLNPLYEMGFSRVGCFPCIMENKRGIASIARHAPERIDLLEKAEQALQSTFFPYSKTPDSVSEKPTIRDVVRWSQMGDYKSDAFDHPCVSQFHKCE